MPKIFSVIILTRYIPSSVRFATAQASSLEIILGIKPGAQAAAMSSGGRFS